MPSTSSPPSTAHPAAYVLIQSGREHRPRFRVIYHEPVCPECKSPAITTEEVETGDGITETAYLCTACGEAWPLACVTDWDTRTPGTANPALTGIASDLEGGQ